MANHTAMNPGGRVANPTVENVADLVIGGSRAGRRVTQQAAFTQAVWLHTITQYIWPIWG